MPGQQRKFKSICQQRYYCELCWKVVFARGDRHKCGQTAPNDEICERCGGLHRWNMPCYIQPVSVEKLNSLLYKRRRPIKNPNSIDITETDDETDEDSAMHLLTQQKEPQKQSHIDTSSSISNVRKKMKFSPDDSSMKHCLYARN